MIERSIRSERGETYYWISRNPQAEAKTLVFTHGAAVDHTMFEKQVEYFKSSCTVIVWDIPLHGRSRPYTEFSYKNAAEELNAILDRENTDRAVLAGLSLGGYVCQHFALLYPNKVEGFVSIDSGPVLLLQIRYLVAEKGRPDHEIVSCGAVAEQHDIIRLDDTLWQDTPSRSSATRVICPTATTRMMSMRSSQNLWNSVVLLLLQFRGSITFRPAT